MRQEGELGAETRDGSGAWTAGRGEGINQWQGVSGKLSLGELVAAAGCGGLDEPDTCSCGIPPSLGLPLGEGEAVATACCDAHTCRPA